MLVQLVYVLITTGSHNKSTTNRVWAIPDYSNTTAGTLSTHRRLTGTSFSGGRNTSTVWRHRTFCNGP